MRILGLDIGSKRIGVALSDELGYTAQGVETVTYTDPESAADRIQGIAESRNVTEIVIGIPYNMNGTEGPQVRNVRDFIERLRKRINVPIHEWDERLTTFAAERVLLEADISRAKRRKVVDKLAAVLILQGFLDSQTFKGSTGV
ncbi:Holliday junction resolvase RuvX [Desulfomonile tiedjei]|uniref:Putative pre-16S rRNA nuclease n=1 Tax=Desulfomonile tiedjei (strain ATCC 49306 / DSM 6799 / DCB-1) TaxID=706587 RepID=I4C3R9_DESTA|nr:Holliday junction resolvase RuvX [Desulfomonile tiedjei]AFM24210.1 RNAse H-fold protein YqgF [Desulfomonile tiedjei DSM 6799]